MSAPPYDSLNLGRSTADLPDAVSENRQRLLASLGLDPSGLVTAGQVHGARGVHAVAPGLQTSCDALWTRTRGLVLAVSSADCLPILYAAPDTIAVAHAGWRGIVAGVVESTLAELLDVAGVGPEQVHAHLGPSIRDCCYVVGPEVARSFPPESLRNVGDEIRLSLPAAARKRLLDAGLGSDSILDCGACTACEPHGYFSHRRDRGLTGRQWGIAALRPAP